jgi:hypothetical protein
MKGFAFAIFLDLYNDKVNKFFATDISLLYEITKMS